MKKEIIGHLYKLIAPYKGRFLLAVSIALLSTGATLIEPLIYREAVNDITGLFVKDANDAAKIKAGEKVEEEEGALENFFRNKVEKEALLLERDFSGHVSPAQPDTVKPHYVKKAKKGHVRKPHSATHVSERTTGEAARTLIWVVAVLFIVNVLSYILWLIGENINVRLNSKIEQRFIQGAFAHVLRLPLEFFGKRSPAAIAKQIDQSEEVSGIMDAISQKILPETISLVGILTIMFWQNAHLTLIAFAVIPLYLFFAWNSSRKLESNLNAYYERWEQVSGRITNALTGIKTVKLSGAESREVQEYARISDQAYRNYVERSLMSNTFTFWQGVLTHLATALVLGYGGYLALIHKLTPGDVVMFVAYLDRLYSPIDELTSLWVNLQQHTASIARAFRLLDKNKEEKHGKALRLTTGTIELKTVSFGYTAERDVLHDVSLTFMPGAVTAIVGGSGAGKTTLVDLLLKLYETDRGSIRIDGQDLNELEASSVRGQIGMVVADGAVFGGTLSENIRYKKPDATDAEVKEAAELAGLTGLITRLPEGLATAVGTNGMGLSVGERQRLQIARVLISRPRILVLDEATANLDYNTEAEVKKAIFKLRDQCTIIIVAHRFSMVHDANFVYVLSEGVIIEQGTPDALIRQNGWFSDFASSVEQTTAAKEDLGGVEENEDDENAGDSN
jgi:ABC-type multidrug transport system fused ATPase/permease subunit